MAAKLVSDVEEPIDAAWSEFAPDRSDRRRVRLRKLELWLPGAVLIAMILLCFAGPLVLPIPKPNSGSLLSANLPPFSRGHILGTDTYGNDLLSRCIYGGRISFEVGVGAVGLGLVIGGFLGVTSGFKGRYIEISIMRGLDMLLAFPALIVAMMIAVYLGGSERNVIFAISFFTIPAFARLSRGATLRVKQRTFVAASRLSGQGDTKIMLRHIVPNVLPSLLTYALLTISLAMIIEATLSFLGLGIPPPAPTWGNLIATGEPTLASQPYLLIAPSAFLFISVLSLNLVGDAVRARWAADL
jgi:peptide/nickel transport system permease protein